LKKAQARHVPHSFTCSCLWALPSGNPASMAWDLQKGAPTCRVHSLLSLSLAARQSSRQPVELTHRRCRPPQALRALWHSAPGTVGPGPSALSQSALPCGEHRSAVSAAGGVSCARPSAASANALESARSGQPRHLALWLSGPCCRRFMALVWGVKRAPRRAVPDKVLPGP